MDKWRQKIFDELDYLKEKESVLEKRKALMDLLLPENKEKLDKFILTLEEIGTCLNYMYVVVNGRRFWVVVVVNGRNRVK